MYDVYELLISTAYIFSQRWFLLSV